MAAVGELLTLEDYRGQHFLDGIKLEWVVHQHLMALDVEHLWLNARGESNSFPDIVVGLDVQVDCKGSTKYFGSMFIGVDVYETMAWRCKSHGEIWYVLNDLSVVSFTEFDQQKERKAGGYRMAPSNPRSINEWLKTL